MQIMDLIIEIQINNNSSKELNNNNSQALTSPSLLMRILENTGTNKETYGIRKEIIRKQLNVIQRPL